jgi:V-type H+-transporting ATPase proteolipid subunit
LCKKVHFHLIEVPATGYKANAAYAHLASGLCCGFSSLVNIDLFKAAGLAIGIVGDAGVRANAQQDKIFVGMILILIFGEALALYGLIVSLILTSQG